MKVPFSYLERQFDAATTEKIFADLKAFVKTGDFTLGIKLTEFEERFAALIGTKHAIGVGSGTDALTLSLKALEIGPGDEVITSAETFIASAGSIAAVGAKPVFVDVDDRLLIDPRLIEGAITAKTRAILPVYFTGDSPQMKEILAIAQRHRLSVVEDSCCAIDAEADGGRAGSLGAAGAFSFHPLKNLNVWSDGGMVTANSDSLAEKIRLLRNHGLTGRDEVVCFGFNSRLDTFQAVVGLHLIDQVKEITEKRIACAKRLDEGFGKLRDFVDVPERRTNVRHVFHLYMVRAKDRDGLLAHCISKGVEAKIHYPIPLPYQKCCEGLGYRRGMFPKTERDCASIISFPCHQHLTTAEIDYTIQTVKEFYAR